MPDNCLGAISAEYIAKFASVFQNVFDLEARHFILALQKYIYKKSDKTAVYSVGNI